LGGVFVSIIWVRGTRTARIYDHIQVVGLGAVMEEAHEGRGGDQREDQGKPRISKIGLSGW
jgi:hypothetical protein